MFCVPCGRCGLTETQVNTGMYLDTPSHRYEGRADLSAIGLDGLADLHGVCVDAPRRGVDPARLTDVLSA